MKKILFSLLSFLLLVQGVGTQAVAAGLPLHPLAGPDSARQLGEQIQNTYINSPQHENGVIPGSTCTTPQMEYDALRRLHPEAKITSIGMAADYLKNLKPERFKDTSAYTNGNIRMTWIDEDGVGICHLRYRHDSRTIGPNDWVFVDPNTNEVVLADCGNFTEILLKTIAVVVAHAHPTSAPVAVQTAPPISLQQTAAKTCVMEEFVKPNAPFHVAVATVVVDGRTYHWPIELSPGKWVEMRGRSMWNGSTLTKADCGFFLKASSICICYGRTPEPIGSRNCFQLDMQMVREEIQNSSGGLVIVDRGKIPVFPEAGFHEIRMPYRESPQMQAPIGYAQPNPMQAPVGYAPAYSAQPVGYGVSPYPYGVTPNYGMNPFLPYAQPNSIQAWLNFGILGHLNLFHPRNYPHPVYQPPQIYSRTISPIPGPRRLCNLPPNPVTGQSEC